MGLIHKSETVCLKAIYLIANVLYYISPVAVSQGLFLDLLIYINDTPGRIISNIFVCQ